MSYRTGNKRALLTVGMAVFLFAEASPQRPAIPWNVVSILVDDLGEWAVGAYGNREVVTPNIDRLAREGARFTNAFAASGVCTPSRVAFFTGLHPLQIGTLFDATRLQGLATEGLPPGVPFWPRVLKQHGYATGLIGKWHLGATPEAYPTNFGIDYYFGFLGGSLSTPMAPRLVRDRQAKAYEGHTADLFAQDAIRFIEAHRAEPFALLLNFREPHVPYVPVPKADSEAVRHLDPTVPVLPDGGIAGSSAVYTSFLKNETRNYYASIHALDRNVGRILATLDSLGLADRTIVLFTSDQGALLGHRGLREKGMAVPIQLGSLSDFVLFPNMFDRSLRVPLIIKWPGVAQPGMVIPELVSNIDTYASVLGMLGIAKPADASPEGRDLSPLLRGQRTVWRDAVFAQYTPDQVGNIEFLRMIRTDRWKLVRGYLNPSINQLYDLEADPEELRNLYYREILAPTDSAVPRLRVIRDSLERRLLEWQRSIDDPALLLEKDFLEARRKARARWATPP
jgi:uncharacterized sulfatase